MQPIILSHAKQTHDGCCTGFRNNFASPGCWGLGCYFSTRAQLSCGGYRYTLPAAEAANYGCKAAFQVMRVKVLTGSAFTSPNDGSLKIPPLVKDIPMQLRSVSLPNQLPVLEQCLLPLRLYPLTIGVGSSAVSLSNTHALQRSCALFANRSACLPKIAHSFA